MFASFMVTGMRLLDAFCDPIIGTIMNADNIIVLEKGECVGMGTHRQLLKNCKVYQEIAYSQLSKEELNG